MLLQFQITVLYLNVLEMYFSDGKAKFAAVIIPVFSVKWSFRDHFNMPIWC